MSAVPIELPSGERGIAACGRIGIVWLLLAAGIGGPAGAALAAAPLESGCPSQDESCGGAVPLDQLSLMIGNLKASLSALRQDLEARRDRAEDGEQAIVDELCAAPLAEAGAARDSAISELEQLRATAERERAAASAAAAAAGGELSDVRERLASAEAEVARLNEDRARLVNRIQELDAMFEKARTAELVAALAGAKSGAPMDAAQAAEPEAAPEPQLMLRVAQPGPAALVSPGSRASAAERRSAPPVDRLQLQAELALAQLKIAELTTALESARLRQEGMEAEVSTLRSLTDAKIRQLMGWQ